MAGVGNFGVNDTVVIISNQVSISLVGKGFDRGITPRAADVVSVEEPDGTLTSVIPAGLPIDDVRSSAIESGDLVVE